MNRIKTAVAFLRYNALHVFGGRFVVFLGLAMGLFFLILVIGLLGRGGTPNSENLYNYLLAPGILLVFYPSVYGIQRDQDTRMVETLFGIPDYRYKVWLTRLVTLYIIIAVMMFALVLLCRLTLADFPIWRMVFHVMIPVIFLGSLAFYISAQSTSGNVTAVIMVIFLLFFWVLAEEIQNSSWFLFHNPFRSVDALRSVLWAQTTFYNRLYLIMGSVVATLFALLRLQNREKFI
ncbi:MAG: hypothetical protein JRD02_00060 [Deltaproteobacteria bacterium]|nr:hypothetical protein [Deltaproteobacteria bacterium]